MSLKNTARKASRGEGWKTPPMRIRVKGYFGVNGRVACTVSVR